MNYPVWEVFFGSGLLMALVSVVHVFVAHFAVGGGLFLVLTEHKIYHDNDQQLLDWLKKHTRFFVLVTVVFGAVTGVGIWFVIGLIQPTATSNLIHAFVWAWAIEWVFFFLEITAALLYLYGWAKVERTLHLIYGWIYFVSAFLSMVVINGMITFMLTPGDWLQNHNFWDGFLNPTYGPSLVTRFLFSLALAGIYALITASVQKNKELKGKIVKWSLSWIIPTFLLLIFSAWWYKIAIPEELWVNAKGLLPTAARYLNLMIIFAVLTFLLSLLILMRSKHVTLLLALIITLSAFVTMWSFEFVREALRKPYVIYDYVYGNSLYKNPLPNNEDLTVERFQEAGMLQKAKWIQNRQILTTDKYQAGQEIFRLQCLSCHTIGHYRSIKKYLKKYQWDEQTLAEMLKGIDLMRNGIMPPFAGNAQERQALAYFLVRQLEPVKPEPVLSGEILFEHYCGMCHQKSADDPALTLFKELDEESALETLNNLSDLVEQMPTLHLSEAQRKALFKWFQEQ